MTTTDPLLERSFSDYSAVPDGSQPELFHPTNRIVTDFPDLHSNREEQPKNQSMHDNLTNAGINILLNADSVPPDLLSPIDHRDSTCLAELAQALKPAINFVQEEEQNDVTSVHQLDEDDISQSIYALEPPAIPKEELTPKNKKKNKRKEAMKGIAPLDFSKQDQSNIPIAYEAKIDEGSTEIVFQGKSTPVSTDQLYSTDKLGEGAFGKVCTVVLNGPPEICMAVKCVSRSHRNEHTKMKLLGTKGCPHIVEYYGAVAEPNEDKVFICMERMDTSLETLTRAMHTIPGIHITLIECLVCRIIHDVASGLEVLNSERIIHQDIKPANILINENGMVKLCDFGVSRSWTELNSGAPLVAGTDLYMPPSRELNIQDDMWALGISMLELIDNENPFARLESTIVPLEIFHWTPAVPTIISIELQELLLRLLEKEAGHRPRSYAEILNHPMIRSVPPIPSNDERRFLRRIFKQIR